MTIRGLADTGRGRSWVVVVAIAVAACGSSGDATATTPDSAPSDVAQTAATEAAPTGSEVTTTVSAEPDSASTSDGGVNGGSVTVGDVTFEFDATPGTITDCDPDFFGAFWVIGESPDGDTITILLPPDGDTNFEDPPSVQVNVNNGGADFTADPSLIDTSNYDTVISNGDSQVDSFTIDGNSASGTATFVDENDIFAALGGTADDPEPIQGSFEVTCAEE